MITFLIKPGELSLKGGNRKSFEKILHHNLAVLLKGSGAQISVGRGRYFVRCPEDCDVAQVEDSLGRLIGISAWAKTQVTDKDPDNVIAACVNEGRLLFDRGITTFKVEARRTDKSYPLDSYKIRCLAGDAIQREIPALKVDVQKPGGIIKVEIREKAYIYGITHEGRRGLPVGSAGKGLLLLSGGIDSPVAGYMMASRGMALDAVHFHAYPYTSVEAREKTAKLAEILGRYTQGIRLYVMGFTAIQARIKDKAPEAWRTILLRMAMMECAEKLAIKRGCKCLISGESLSQVASQTIENITCTQSVVKLPVFRPLIGMNKEDIIAFAEDIGTYKTSILPFEDCCILFSPPHPVLRGDPVEALNLYGELNVHSLIEEAHAKAEM
ncbi:MAG: tRNA 4-thiouridine(8) synthase ThiI, partial [Treponema sp.]|nr:tRNA 4-thiouridine(8) synthase ThiI [Treponema sp.]